MQIKTNGEKREPRITLKQYIHSNSLRKKAQSRCSSKESSIERSKLSANVHPEKPKECPLSTNQTKRNQLIEDIKIKLAQFIPQDCQLISILKKLDLLVTLFNHDLKEQIKQKDVMASMLTQSKLHIKTPSLQSKQSKIVFQQNICFDIPDQDLSFHELSASRHHLRTHQRGESDSLADIPNINLLLMTRNKEIGNEENHENTQCKKEVKKENKKQSNNSFCNDTFCSEDYLLNTRNRKPSATINLFDPHRHKYEQEASEVRISLRSSVWNNFEPRATRNKHQQYK